MGDEEQGWVLVSLERLAPWDPFANCVWQGLSRPITRSEVAAAIRASKLEPQPVEADVLHPASRKRHIARVAYLVKNPPNDPIEIDVGVPSLGCLPSWIIADGNHRLAAAFYRKDLAIRTSISGEVNYAAELLGIPAEQFRMPPAEEATT